jgi:hypothetical protein
MKIRYCIDMPKRRWGPFIEDDCEILVNIYCWTTPIFAFVRENGISFDQVENLVDEFVYEWCEKRKIELLWRVPHGKITQPPVASQAPQSMDALNLKSLLVFRNPQDKMLFKLYFNSDA